MVKNELFLIGTDYSYWWKIESR